MPPEPLTPEAIEGQRVQRVADIKAWLPRLVGRFQYEGVVDLNGDMITRVEHEEKQRKKDKYGPKADDFLGTEEDESAEEYVPADGGECKDDGAGGERDWLAPVVPCKIKRVHGLGDCTAIGTGPGVHCVMDVTWPDVSKLGGAVIRGEEPFLSPATMLYGIDANAASIRYLLLDKDGLTEAESAVIQGNNLRWIFYPGETDKTRRVTRIYAPPDGRFVQTVIEIEELTATGWRLLASIVFDGRRVAPDAPADES